MDGINGTMGGGMSRLRDVMRRQRKDLESSIETPDLDFKYTDSDTNVHELAELYAYSEVPEFENTKLQFESSLEEAQGTARWHKLSSAKKRVYVMGLIDRFEVRRAQDRLSAVRQLLYLAHGNYRPGLSEADLCHNARQNVYLLLQMGAFEAIVDLLALEMEQGRGVYEVNKANITIANNHNLRTCLSLLYVIVETARREEPDDPPEWSKARKLLVQRLSGPAAGEESLTSLLFNMLLGFCSGSMPHYPVKKTLLLIWKCILTTMGGTETLKYLKKEARLKAGLQPTYPDLQPSRPLIFPTAAFDPRGHVANTPSAAATPLSGSRVLPSALSTDADPVVMTGKVLEFRPKARKKDVEAFVETCQAKFCCFEEEGGDELAGLPEPIRESVRVLRDHVYVPLSDVQIAQEAAIESKKSTTITDGSNSSAVDPPVRRINPPAEALYHSLLPNMPQYMIALLKVLLAAAPTSRSRSDSLNILVDVLPPEAPSSIVESTQVTLDINRHKEIIVKAVSAIVFLLLKHFKVNHVYQFEYVCQQLVFANCIPLILKFFNQNVVQYVSSRNNYPILNFPDCVLCPSCDGESAIAALETSNTTTDQGYCWRNLFSCINLVRILQKLTKWKRPRTVMLVVFRSAPILKRALKVRHAMFQLYVLKLLKVQTKYLGRNWRRSNMTAISAIYHRVRHHLHDDWAYGNDLDTRPWDFQTEELTMKPAIELFNSRYYSLEPGMGGASGGGGGANLLSEEAPPLDHNRLSVLEENVAISQSWKQHYEEWVELEVFLMPKDWDAVLQSSSASLEVKIGHM